MDAIFPGDLLRVRIYGHSLADSSSDDATPSPNNGDVLQDTVHDE